VVVKALLVEVNWNGLFKWLWLSVSTDAEEMCS
jgi:hypothetical protein